MISRNKITLQDILHRLKDPKPDGRGGVWAFCPCHNDGAKRGRRSLHVEEKSSKLLFHCFAGCEYRDIITALGLERIGTSNGPEAAYDYTDEVGRLLFQVCRMPGKRFVQRRPDGAGGWECEAMNATKSPAAAGHSRNEVKFPVQLNYIRNYREN